MMLSTNLGSRGRGLPLCLYFSGAPDIAGGGACEGVGGGRKSGGVGGGDVDRKFSFRQRSRWALIWRALTFLLHTGHSTTIDKLE